MIGLIEGNADLIEVAGEGHPNIEIAQRFHLAEGTVRNYLSSAIVKLGARNRTEAFVKAQEMGYL